ncbi:MAG: GIY-YIG nuclease family protein [Bacteroidetes bacterium]|nr:GIY-YIG nuclease family protein [Bacteroidota bacterium]MBT6685290.1 GIY-YIG nuclease family protein [Bacteroidota bacterium]MBT7141737.1 GIY-YIG nuclease family protein [Bacteroidota bacterium]MBT7491435.1 GIY-YIG nuclease family protein [Bacteroidota bacterium]
MYAIIDIETTGGSFRQEKITEIAIYVHDGEKVINEFSSLLNPERYIPQYITKITGITNEMVADAPKFFEIAKTVFELTENCIFVAHNVSFDYNFVKKEFKELGFDYHRDQLCTVKLSRKLLPGKPSYSLGNLCKSLRISNNARHRAAGDALATVSLFEILLSADKNANNSIPVQINDSVKKKILSSEKELIKNLPNETGIYYFYNYKNEIIYVGKSKDIYKRVLSHFQNNSSRRAIEMKENTSSIDCEVTGNELIALLKESSEIKKHKPLYNRAQRRTFHNYGIYNFVDGNDYIQLKIDKNKSDDVPITSFSSQVKATKFLSEAVEKHILCQKLSGLYQSKESCFQYGINKCLGACIGKEQPASYNVRAEAFIKSFDYDHHSFFIIDKGRHAEEKALVKIEKGKYIGFGYTDINLFSQNIEYLSDCIKPYEDNRDIKLIINSYLKKGKAERILRF